MNMPASTSSHAVLGADTTVKSISRSGDGIIEAGSCGISGAVSPRCRTNPEAAKRAVRALLKAADVCALEPERGAQLLVERGFTPRYDYALETLRELPYNKWREYDAEDTVRFYALRLHGRLEIRWPAGCD